MGLNVRMRGRPGQPGSHSVYDEDDGSLVVEWYDFGEGAPYESANMLIFTRERQAAVAAALGIAGPPDAEALARALADRFESYFDVREFLDTNGLAYRHKVDFQP